MWVCALCGREGAEDIYPLCEAHAATVGDTVGLFPDTTHDTGGDS